MNTAEITPKTLAASVIAVPPLARHADESLNADENRKLVRHLEAGGVSTLLYGGNAVLYHVALSEYTALLKMLASIVSDSTVVIPSVGPAYGTMMDQTAVLSDFDFPAAMILPTRDVVTSQGVALAVTRFVERFSKPAVLYIKNDGYVDVPTISRLMDDGLIAWIKYAVVREDPGDDRFLQSLIDEVGTERVVSGIGEQPAIVHLRDFGLQSFTSGCVCLAPELSMEMLRALQAGDLETAARIRSLFQPLEDLRNSINPIRVLHAAVSLSGIADTGPLIPLLSEIDADDRQRVRQASEELLAVRSR